MHACRHAWVLEPERPRLADTHRRIALSRHAALLLDLDPAQPRAPPSPSGEPACCSVACCVKLHMCTSCLQSRPSSAAHVLAQPQNFISTP